MNNIKTIALILILFTSITIKAQQTKTAEDKGLTWYTDIMKANEVSKTTNRPIFAFFTGSNWCAWC